MNDDTPVYGSSQLTPAVIRNVRFPGSGAGHQGYAPAAVHEFLEQVASAVEVLGSADAAAAIRRELERSSEISARMVLSGHETAERLRQQAAADAQEIIEDAKRLTEQLRDAARGETERTRQHVEQLRGSFIEELRDMYDRIGATLYRFETASRAGAPAPADPLAAGRPEQHPAGPQHTNMATGEFMTDADELSDQLAHDAYTGESATPIADELGWSTTAPRHETAGSGTAVSGEHPAADGLSDSWLDDNTTTFDAPADESSPPEAAAELAPAWTQIPGELQQTHSVTELAAGEPAWASTEPDSAMAEDTPLAPGEPLVDLRAMHEGAAVGAGDVDAGHAVGEAEPVGEATHGGEPEAGGGWLDDGATDDDRAEAMIAGLDEVLGGAANADVAPEPTYEPEPIAAPEYAAFSEQGNGSSATAPPVGALADELPVLPVQPVELSTEYADAPHPVTPMAHGAAAPEGSRQEAPEDVPAPFGGVETFAQAASPEPDAPAVDAFAVPVTPHATTPAFEQAEAAPAASAAAAPVTDPAVIRQFVLQSLHEGQPREAIEAYLRESLGMADAARFVNDALGQGQG